MKIIKEKKKVLILEDEPDAGMLIAAILESHDFETYLVTTVKEATTALNERVSTYFDLLFFDYNLPDGNSFEIIQNGTLTDGKPTIICSAYLSAADKLEFKEHGVLECLNKPINSDAIKDLLTRHGLIST